MKRVLIVAAAALALAACNKKSNPEPESTDQAVSAGAETADASAEEADAANEADAAEEEEKPHIDAEVVRKYGVYLQGLIAEQKRIIEEIEKLDREKAGAVKTWSKSIAITERFSAAEEKLEKDSGLSEAQIEAMQDLLGSVVLARSMVGEDALAGVRELRKQIDAMPADQRAEAEKTVAEMEKGIEEMRSAKEARERWGDAAVDAVIAEEKTLIAKWKESTEALGAAAADAPGK